MLDSLGIRHLALKVKNFEECFVFYTQVLGMKVDWKPDDQNVYLTCLLYTSDAADDP